MVIIHLVVELAVDGVTRCIDQLEGVGAIAIHVAVAIGDAPVTEEEWDLVSSLWTEWNEVPEHIHILCSREGGVYS